MFLNKHNLFKNFEYKFEVLVSFIKFEKQENSEIKTASDSNLCFFTRFRNSDVVWSIIRSDICLIPYRIIYVIQYVKTYNG